MDLINTQSNSDTSTKMKDITTTRILEPPQCKSVNKFVENNANMSLVNEPVKKKKKRKKSSYKDIMANITQNTKTIEEEKNNHKKQLETLMKSANFEKVNKI